MVIFQFHKGTIKPRARLAGQRAPRYFNSIKVRLNPSTQNHGEMRTKFQFHKGTIKPPQNEKNESSKREFQFHKGTIKPEMWIALYTLCIGISIP